MSALLVVSAWLGPAPLLIVTTLVLPAAWLARLHCGCVWRRLRRRDLRPPRGLRRFRLRCYRLSTLLAPAPLFRPSERIARPGASRHWRRTHGRWRFLLLRDHLDNRRGYRRRWFQFLAHGLFERFSRRHCELLLLRGETGVCRGRCPAGNDGSLEHTLGRFAALGSGAAHASLCRRHGRYECQRCTGDRFAGNAERLPGYWL